MVAKGDGLGRLQMSEARKGGGGFFSSTLDQPLAQSLHHGQDAIDGTAQVQPGVGGHLIIARAARMELLGHIPQAGSQRPLDVAVHVFQRLVPNKRAGVHLLAQRLQGLIKLGALCRCDHACLLQGLQVRQGAGNVFPVQALVEGDRDAEAAQGLTHALGKTPGPQRFCHDAPSKKTTT